MDKLTAAPALDQAPLTIADLRLAVVEPGPMTCVMPFKGSAPDLDAAVQAAHGVGWPANGRATQSSDVTLAWAGKDQALLIGAAADPALAAHAALVDQSDAWAAFELAGTALGAADVLARLCPLDLRDAAFPQGAAARSLLLHCPLLILRVGPETFWLMTFRSMAHTAWHELAGAMRGVAARRGLAQMDQALGSNA